MNLTESQRAAVEHRGTNLLVAASAGSGKTEVLARRCVALLADPQKPCSVDQLLVVTFTRAAAAELRSRVRQMLRTAARETRDRRLREHLQRQDVLVDIADIGTIDAWCGRLMREHFAVTGAGVDPAFTVLGEQQATLLRSVVVDELFEWVYAADDELAIAARDWILRHTKPNDDFLRGMVLELRSQEPRADVYWSQQLAFGPVLFHALALAVRAGTLSDADLTHVRRVIGLAFAALGALPERAAMDPTILQMMACRQATALSWGRRRQLVRLAARLGLEMDGGRVGLVPDRLLRPYPLIGWTAEASE